MRRNILLPLWLARIICKPLGHRYEYRLIATEDPRVWQHVEDGELPDLVACTRCVHKWDLRTRHPFRDGYMPS